MSAATLPQPGYTHRHSVCSPPSPPTVSRSLHSLSRGRAPRRCRSAPPSGVAASVLDFAPSPPAGPKDALVADPRDAASVRGATDGALPSTPVARQRVFRGRRQRRRRRGGGAHGDSAMSVTLYLHAARPSRTTRWWRCPGFTPVAHRRRTTATVHGAPWSRPPSTGSRRQPSPTRRCSSPAPASPAPVALHRRHVVGTHILDTHSMATLQRRWESLCANLAPRHAGATGARLHQARQRRRPAQRQPARPNAGYLVGGGPWIRWSAASLPPSRTAPRSTSSTSRRTPSLATTDIVTEHQLYSCSSGFTPGATSLGSNCAHCVVR